MPFHTHVIEKLKELYLQRKFISIISIILNHAQKLFLSLQCYLHTKKFSFISHSKMRSRLQILPINWWMQLVKSGFKISYKQQIHQNTITQIITQKEYLITALDDTTIIKTNFIIKNQIFKLVGHSQSVISIDYDILKDIMISTSDDNTLIIWDCMNQSILIDHNLEDSFLQIQLINNNKDILKCAYNRYQEYVIDFENKELDKIHSYIQCDQNDILSYQQVNNDQNLLLIYEQCCLIFNKEGELVNKIEHNLKLESINWIILIILFYKMLTNHIYQEQKIKFDIILD